MILRAVAELTGLGLVLIASVTRQAWIACAVLDRIEFGLSPGDPLDKTILCEEIRDSQQPLVLEHLSGNTTYRNHPAVLLRGIESYIGVPILHCNGEYFGNLCALDHAFANLSDPKLVQMMRLFSQLISSQLQAEERYAIEHSALLKEKHDSEERERYLAILGHDLRSPLSAIDATAQALSVTRSVHYQHCAAERIARSVRRISNLVEDILDFTRDRHCGGIRVERRKVERIDIFLKHIVEEVQETHPDRWLSVQINCTGVVECDPARIGQVLSNLLSNALEHDDSHGKVEVFIETYAGALTISVHNGGTPIPPAKLPTLFQAFNPDSSPSRHAGLGLGLYIAARIAKAHNAALNVTSSAERGTKFTLHMPAPPRI